MGSMYHKRKQTVTYIVHKYQVGFIKCYFQLWLFLDIWKKSGNQNISLSPKYASLNIEYWNFFMYYSQHIYSMKRLRKIFLNLGSLPVGCCNKKLCSLLSLGKTSFVARLDYIKSGTVLQIGHIDRSRVGSDSFSLKTDFLSASWVRRLLSLL